MSQYPNEFDTDADLPRISDNATEINSEAINAIRSAVFAIQAALGKGIQGSQPTLEERISAVLEPDGTFKSAALVAAGLIALPIDNSMVAESAAIEESKLALAYSTTALSNAIESNDIDIGALQESINSVLANFVAHISGVSFKHDGYQILLDQSFPSSSPPAISPLTTINFSDTIVAIKNYLFEHTATSAVGSHTAANISVDNTEFTRISGTDVQSALEELDLINEHLFVEHRDDLHSNGLSNFSNNRDGYGYSRQIIPAAFGATEVATVLLDRQTVEFTGLNLLNLGVSAGDILRVTTPEDAVGTYSIEAVGPRSAIGLKPALAFDQLSVNRPIPYDGAIDASIHVPSTTSTLRGNLAPTVHQSDVRVDSIQVSRPNAAKILTLGARPEYLTAAHTLAIEFGVGAGLTRTLTIADLNTDRFGNIIPNPTIDTVIGRINYVAQNRFDGYAAPVAAYRIGDEILLSHNWQSDSAYFLRILGSPSSTEEALYILGLDQFGANVVDIDVLPTNKAYFYVNGIRRSDVAEILNTTAGVSGTTVTFTSGENPLDLGVRTGHLLHLKTHSITEEIGTYFITGVTSTSCTIHKNAGITADTDVEVQILHDTIPFDDLNSSSNNLILQTYFDYTGKPAYSIRGSYPPVATVGDNFKIVDVADGLDPGDYTLGVSDSGGGKVYQVTGASARRITNGFIGRISIPDPSGSSTIFGQALGTVSGADDFELTVLPHIFEKELLELATVHLDTSGVNLAHLTDKRLFGTLGLDEVREDVVREYSELPIRELRADGIVSGFDILAESYQDSESVAGLGSDIYGVLIRGGIAYAAGSRLAVATQPVYLPNENANFLLYLNQHGTIQHARITSTPAEALSELADGYYGNVCAIATVARSTSGPNFTISNDNRFFINNIDFRVEWALDTTNRSIGTFSTIESAIAHINSMPYDDKAKLTVVSDDPTYTLNIPVGTRPFTLNLDGRVGSIIVQSPCAITTSRPGQGRPHAGTLVTASNPKYVVINGLEFSDGITLESSDPESLFIVENCIVGSTSIFNTAGTLSIEHTSIGGGSNSITAADFYGKGIIVTGGEVTLDVSGMAALTQSRLSGIVLSIAYSEYAHIQDTVFTNSTLNSGGRVLCTHCVFADKTSTNERLIYAHGVGAIGLESCDFRNLTLTSTAMLSESIGTSQVSFRNCTFEDVLLPTAKNTIVTNFIENTIKTDTTKIHLGIARTGIVRGNDGIASVEYHDDAVDNNIILISENRFLVPDLAYNIRVNPGSGDGYGLLIQENDFQHPINLDSNSDNTRINSNRFFGVYAVDFGATAKENIRISDNDIHCSGQPFAGVGVITQLQLINNRILSGSAPTAAYVGDGLRVTGNTSIGYNEAFGLIANIKASHIQIDRNSGLRLEFTGDFEHIRLTDNESLQLDSPSLSRWYQYRIKNNEITQFSPSNNIHFSEGDLCGNTLGTRDTGPNMFFTLLFNKPVDDWTEPQLITRISSNQILFTYFITTESTIALPEMSGLILSENSGFGNIILNPGINTVENIKIHRNSSLFLISLESGSYNNISISANTLDQISIVGDLSNIKIVSNSIDELSIDGTLLETSVISGNTVGTLVIRSISLVDLLLSDNQIGTAVLNKSDLLGPDDLIIHSLLCSGNIFNSLEIGAQVSTNCIIARNRFKDYFEVNKSVSGIIVHIIISENIGHTIVFPSLSHFSGQAKILNNSFFQWDGKASGKIVAGVEIFPWGNTGDSSPDENVSFVDVTARTVGNTNNLEGDPI